MFVETPEKRKLRAATCAHDWQRRADKDDYPMYQGRCRRYVCSRCGIWGRAVINARRKEGTIFRYQTFEPLPQWDLETQKKTWAEKQERECSLSGPLRESFYPAKKPHYVSQANEAKVDKRVIYDFEQDESRYWTRLSE